MWGAAGGLVGVGLDDDTIARFLDDLDDGLSLQVRAAAKEPAGCGKGGGAWPLDFHPWNHCKLWFTAGVLNPLPNVCVLNPLQEPPIRSMEPPRLPRAVLLAGVVWRGPPFNAFSDASVW